MDATPLAKPINAFQFVRAKLRQEIAGIRAMAASPQRDVALKRGEQILGELDPWLQHLQRQVAYETTQPVLAAAIGQLARDGAERKRFLDALRKVDDLTDAALRARPTPPG